MLSSILSYFTTYHPTLITSHHSIVITIHFIQYQAGFRCVGVDENKEEGKDMGIIPSGWDRSSDSFTFVYTHPSYPTTERVVIKSLPLGNKLMLYGLKKSQSNKVENIEIIVDDYINKDSLSDYSKLYRDGSGLLSLIERFLAPLTPKTTHQPSPAESSQQPTRTYPSQGGDPLRIPTRQPRYPYIGGGGDLDGDGELAHPHFSPFSGGGMGGDFARDLDPFGGNGGGWGSSVGGLGGGVGGFGGMGPFSGGGIRPGGNLFGPERFRDPHRDFVTGGGGGGARPRFDPYGPVPGINRDPDPDHLRPTGPQAFPFDYTIQSHTQPATFTSPSTSTSSHPPSSSSISASATSAALPSSTSSSTSSTTSTSTSTPLNFSDNFNQDYFS